MLCPARDEAARVGPCLRGAARPGSVPDLEMLVLDDGSTDGTADGRPASRPAATRVRLLDGRRRCRPAGSASRTPASSWRRRRDRHGAGLRRRRRGARAGRGRRDRATCCAEPAWTCVCPYPRQLAETSVGAAGAAAAAVVVARRSCRCAWPSVAAAVACPRRTVSCWRSTPTAYERAGGHAAVRAEVLEDVALVRAVKRAGGRGGVADGTRLATCRMYDGWAGAARRLHQVAVGRVRLAGRRRRRSWPLLGLLYVVPAARRRCAGRWSGLAGYAAARGRPGAGRRGAPAAAGWPDALAHPASVLLLGLADRRVVAAAPRGTADLEGPRPLPGRRLELRARGRVVVVGAGMGGLAAAARLAALGHRVTVCEQAGDGRRQARACSPATASASTPGRAC